MTPCWCCSSCSSPVSPPRSLLRRDERAGPWPALVASPHRDGPGGLCAGFQLTTAKASSFAVGAAASSREDMVLAAGRTKPCTCSGPSSNSAPDATDQEGDGTSF